MKGRILVAGAAGRLGAALVQAFGADVLAYGRQELDITDAVAVRKTIARAAPVLIFNCAAFNDVDGAEDRPSQALAVNAYAVRSLARAAESCGATFVHFGSDFVFDGAADEPYDETAPASPRSVYGLSKLLGDWFALEAPRGFALRVESLFGSAPDWAGRQSSLDHIVDGLERGSNVRVFTDRVVSPSYVPDVVRAVRHLLESKAPPGLYHCVNSGHATWHDVAAEAARLMGVPPRLQPVTLAETQFRAARPRFCALSNQKLEAAGCAMPAWNDALQRWLLTRQTRSARVDKVHG